ncbi:nucleotidyltransferase [Gorillibacterium sp. sgz500922]|uniref:nucleotidyltransferase n=1 Tax=Gorillibacterium sp. sgz500922 TaxID=3446694 RepID=UPI003F6740AB
MKTVGIVVEYNPLHNGHVHHAREAKRAAGAEALVAVMSGPFLQRGEPAVCSKWARAEMALAMGADVVLELPSAFAVQPAEWFAFGGVSALHATGVVDALVFGSESGDIAWFRRLAALLAEEPPALKARLRERLAAGASYPAAYASAAAALAGGPDGSELAQPNNILGLQYCLALARLGSGIVPLTIPRRGAGFHDTAAQAPSPAAEAIASATAVRRLLLQASGAEGLAAAAPYLPPYAAAILRREWEAGRGPMDWERYAAPLFHLLLSRPPEAMRGIAEIGEGLEHRFRQLLPRLDYSRGGRIEQLVEAARTRRYTRTKLQRALTSLLLDRRKDELTQESLSRGVPYLRVLGFSGRGRELLKDMKRKASVPIVTKAAKAEQDELPLFGLDLRAAAAYASAMPVPDAREIFRDYYQAPLQTESAGVARPR